MSTFDAPGARQLNDDEAELRRIEAQIRDVPFAQRARGWCGCQAVNLLLGCIFIGASVLAKSTGKLWILPVFVCSYIGCCVAFTVWIIYAIYSSKRRPAPATSDVSTENEDLASSTLRPQEPILAFDSTTRDDATILDFAYRWESVVYEWIFGVVFALGGAAAVVNILWLAISRGSVSPVGGWGGLLGGLALGAAFLFISCGMLANSIAQLNTKYSSAGISRFNLRRKRWIAWKDVTRAELYGMHGEGGGFYLWLHAPGEIMRIDLRYYRTPKAALEEIKKLLPVALTLSKRKTILPFEHDQAGRKR